MKIATWNVNSLKVRLPHVLDWLATTGADIVGLQETKLADDNFPVEAFAQAGYDVMYAGQKTYNGVAVVARRASVGPALGPMRDPATSLPDFPDPQRRVLAVSMGDWRIVNLYVPNGQSVGSDKYRYKLDWLAALQRFVAAELARYEHLVVMGDFNIAPGDEDVYDPAAWAGLVLCSEPEREALSRLFELGLADSFRHFEQPPGTYSWWDYRGAAFQRGRGLRIDLILTSPAATGRLAGAWVDAAPRALERPSDHAPSVAEFTLLDIH